MKIRLYLALPLMVTTALLAQETGQHHEHGQTQAEPNVFFPMTEQPEMEMHHHGQIQEVTPRPPRLGNSQRVVSGPVYRLEELEKMASEHNPTLSQAQQAVDAVRARARQSGLYPNPAAGYQGEEIRGGSSGGGEQGFFVAQPIILGGKLGWNRRVGASEVKQQQAELEAQRERVENDVRIAFYRVLAAQERLAMIDDLAAIAQRTVQVVHQLANVGQADETEVLETEVDEQRMELALDTARHMRQREWTMLTSVIGVPSLPDGSMAGAIDAELPSPNQQGLLTTLLSSSPEMKLAHAGVERAEAALARARREPIPDLTVRAGLENNFEELNAIAGKEIGMQGFAEIGVTLPIWNRNQGGISAARAELEAANNEVSRVELVLRKRLAMYMENYQSARLAADRYRTEILPRLERAYTLMMEQYGLMNASFIRVLTLQRMLYQNELAYIDALERVRTSDIALSGFLLQDGLGENPSRPFEALDNPTQKLEDMNFRGGMEAYPK